MANDTTITIVGNLTRDPELRFTPSGAAWVRFAIAATPRRFDQGSGQWIDADPLFLDCTAWREFAEHIANSLIKGMRVVAAGRLRQRSWETSDGQKRTTFELDLEDIGPSLRWATAKVRKASPRNDQAPPPPEDPWAAPVNGSSGNGSSPAMAAAGTASTPGGSSAGSSTGHGAYEEPPF